MCSFSLGPCLCRSLYGKILTIISLNIASCPFSTFSSSGTPNDYGCCCSVAKPCLTLCNPMDCTSSPHGLHFLTPWTALPHPMDCTSSPPHQTSLSFTVSWGLLKLTSTELATPSKYLIFCYPLFLLPSIFPSIRVFSSESTLHIRWPKYWSFSYSISPSNEYSGLISFRINWFDLLVVQGTLKSLLQHHSSKASILWLSVFFTVQLSHSYMTTGKTIALTIQTFVGKVMSLLFNTMSGFVIAFLPRSKCLLIS